MKYLIYILKAAFITGLVVLVLVRFDASKAGEVLASARVSFAVMSLLLSLLLLYPFGFRTKMVARGLWPDKSISALKIASYNLSAVFYTLFIPTTIAGEAVRIYRIGRDAGNDFSGSTIVVMLDRMLGAFLWLAVFLFSPTPFESKKLLFVVIALPLGAVLSWKKIKFFGRTLIDFSRHHPGDIALGITFSLIAQAGIIICNILMLKCFGIDIGFANMCGIVSLSAIAAAIPVTWLGIGLREGAYIGLLPFYGVPATHTLIIASFLVLSNYFFGLLGGIIELANEGWQLSKLKSTSREEIKILQ